MIKSDDGRLEIEGIQGAALFDFAHIYAELIKESPETVAAVVLRYADKLEAADIDGNIVDMAIKLLSHIPD